MNEINKHWVDLNQYIVPFNIKENSTDLGGSDLEEENNVNPLTSSTELQQATHPSELVSTLDISNLLNSMNSEKNEISENALIGSQPHSFIPTSNVPVMIDLSLSTAFQHIPPDSYAQTQALINSTSSNSFNTDSIKKRKRKNYSKYPPDLLKQSKKFLLSEQHGLKEIPIAINKSKVNPSQFHSFQVSKRENIEKFAQEHKEFLQLGEHVSSIVKKYLYHPELENIINKVKTATEDEKIKLYHQLCIKAFELLAKSTISNNDILKKNCEITQLNQVLEVENKKLKQENQKLKGIIKNILE
jgi:hypothetical protein